jgi:hypothetical protein
MTLLLAGISLVTEVPVEQQLDEKKAQRDPGITIFAHSNFPAEVSFSSETIMCKSGAGK